MIFLYYFLLHFLCTFFNTLFYTFHALSLSLPRLLHRVAEDAAGTGLVGGALGENCGDFGFCEDMRVRTAGCSGNHFGFREAVKRLLARQRDLTFRRIARHKQWIY